MTINWSLRASEQLVDILRTIIEAQSFELALEWKHRIEQTVDVLCDYPHSGRSAPEEIFDPPPLLIHRLRMLVCRPYRIIYEVVEDECRILAVMHSRQMAQGDQMVWDKGS